MKKKKISISEKRIKQNEASKKVNILKIVFTAFLVLLLLISELFKKYLEINSGIINNSLLMFNKGVHIIFGNMYYLFVLTLIITVIYNILEIRVSQYKKSIFCVAFLMLSAFFTISKINVSGEKSLIEASQKLLEFGFGANGAGLIGGISSIPIALISSKWWCKIGLLVFSIIFFLISFSRIIALLISMIVETNKYYNSEEYLKKKQILEVKKKIEEEEKEILNKARENRVKNVIITLANDKLDKKISEKPKENYFEKTQYYSKEELEEQQKKWNEYIAKQNELKYAKDEKRRKEELETQISINDEEIKEKSEQKIEIKKEIQEQTEQNPMLTKSKTIDDDLKKSIEEVFIYKKASEEEKIKMKHEINENIQKLEKVLSEFGVDAKVVDYATGPTITRYEITIPTGVRVNKVTQLSDEISMYLEAESVRFEAPIPGKSTIGIETPNKIKENVYFSNLIHDKKLEDGELNVVLGKDIIGKDKIIDIAKMPHLLIAGQTGSGKSVAINTIVSTLISKKSPDEVKFILVDPKMVELMPYNGIPHLLVPVIIDPEQAAIALKWAVSEMELRYKKLAELGIRNIKSYNKMMPNYKMPYIVIIIDELADLMMVSANTVETSIARIAQKARAVGIHLIVATQRPSTDVITGMIKANLPSRISFALRSQIDSRTILDQIGAEKLLGRGDMLLLESGSSKLERIQGAYISDEEVVNLTTVLKSNSNVEYNMDILTPSDDEEDSQDPYYEKAVELVKQTEDKVSISMLQRELRIGYNRAARINEELKNNGVLDESGYKISI